MKNILSIFIFLICCVLLVSVANAAPPAEKIMPKSGSLSRSMSDVYGNLSVPEPWGGVDAQGSESSPISGSVSRLSPSMWQMRVFNNSDDTYSVDVSVVQSSKSGSHVKTDSFSYTLRAKQKAERQFQAGIGAEQCALKLVNWKNLSARKNNSQPASETKDAPVSATK